MTTTVASIPSATPTAAAPLTGRVGVVTGASSGIGSDVAAALAAGGARVALLARRGDRLEQLAGEIRDAGGTALAVETDVTSQRSIDAAADQVEAQLGRVDLVLNNAGIMLPAPIEERRLDDWERQIDINVTGVMRTIHAFVPQLIAAAAQGGPVDLINTSSVGAQYLFPNFAVYTATKAFVSHLTRHLRLELGPKHVRVSMLEPGIVTTELQSHVTDNGARTWLADALETMEVLTGDDIARIVVFLASQPPHVNLQQITVMPTQQGA
jgi:NADP-dependent 3-hydroxy acid dehydrogenase YdfG